MKKIGIMNSEISSIVSKMGHTDSLVICDSGLPIPSGVKRIDLALKRNLPSFLDTLCVVLEELRVEEIVIASEIKQKNPTVYDKLKKIIEEESKKQGENIKITMVEHEDFKEMTKSSMAIVRTGECSPFANIILKSGVIF